jgi:hypothetical protein
MDQAIDRKIILNAGLKKIAEFLGFNNWARFCDLFIFENKDQQ